MYRWEGEGTFPVPLSYHAGIGVEQEASWVGLGWNINVGSITRNINGFPDDASGETQSINVRDLTGRRGWYTNFLGLSMGWDSQVGHYGTAVLGPANANWDDKGGTVGLGGIYIGKDGRVDAVELGMTVVRIAAAILTEGASEISQLPTNIAMDVGSTVMQQAAVAASFTAPQAPTSQGFWQYSADKDKKLLGLYTNYWYWLDQSRTEEMYGVLNLHKVQSTNLAADSYTAFFATVKTMVNGTEQTTKQFPKSTEFTTKGAASDINVDLSSDAAYQENMSPTMLAYDNFYVNGPGISGSIRPYRSGNRCRSRYQGNDKVSYPS